MTQTIRYSRSRGLRWTVWVALALLLTGCTLRLTYNHLDWLISWQIDDYIDWNDEQQNQFDRKLKAHLAWHRETQLLRYRQWLISLKQDLQEPVSVARLQSHVDQLDRFVQTVLQQLEPDIVQLLSQLSDRQVEALLEEVADENAEQVEEYGDMPAQALHKQRRKNMRKQVQRWTGHLDDGQRALIADWAERLGDDNDDWLASRANWSRQFAQALARRQDRERFTRAIHRLFVEPEQLWPEGYRENLERRTRETLALLVKLHASLDAKQQRRLNKSLDKWIALMAELAEDAD